jgi:type II secretory pathway component HofQ
MAMHRLLSVATLALGMCLALPAHAERSAITVTPEGHDLTVVVHNVTDYCTTNAHTDVVRRGSTIRIVRDRPTRVSRCMDQRDVTFVVHDVPAGTYTVTYEQIPLIAPARTMTIASTTTTVAP